MAEEVKYNNTLVSGRADETLSYTRYIKDESSGKSAKELLDEKVNKTDQLGTTQIADNAVTNEKLAEHSVDNSKLSPDSVSYEKIQDGAVITEKIQDKAITTEKVEEKAVTNSKLGDQSVDGRVVREASLESKHFANESVTTEKVARKSITKDKLADNSVDDSKVVDGSIGNAKLSPESVTTEKIKDSSVTNEKVANDTLGIEKFDPELRKTIQAATGLPDDLIQTIQDVDKSVKQLKEKDTDLQSQIDDKQQQITSNDEDISLLQTRSTQMEEAIKGISASGGASVASAVTYDNTESGLDSIAAQGAIDELANKKFDKENIAQEFGESKDKVVSQFALPFREIESPEFLHCIVDAEDHFLLGIKLDGSIEWGKGIPAPIRAKLQEIINQCQQDKTDVLEAINTAKEELSASITALQEGKVDKEEGKSLIEDEVKECFKVIENEEFIKAIVDSEDKILFGFYRATGKPYYPLNEMYHVEQNEEYFALWIDAADHVLLGIRRDGEIIGEIHAVNALKQVIAQLQSDLTSLQEKVGTIATSLQELLSVFSLQDTPEYLAVETDADGKVLSATNADGSRYIHNAKSETIPEEFSHIEDPEGRIEITTDSENKVLGQRYADGERYEHKMKIDELNLGDLNMGENVSNKILQLVDSQPKQVEIKKWHLPKYGTVNIKQETFYLTANDGYTDKSGIYPIVINEDTQENAQKALTVLKFFVKSTLTDNGDGTYSKKENSVGLDFYVPSQVTIVDGVAYVTSSLTKSDTDGTYSVNDESIMLTKIVDKPTIGAWKVDKKTEHQCTVDIDFGYYLKGTFSIGIKYQGSSTLYNRKRNFRFTFYKDSKFSKKDKIKIGEMVRTSGFNLKANYSDQSRIKEFIMNRVLMEIWGDREEYHNYPWDSEDEPYSGATGMIKGFPVRVNIGGEFYGLDIFGLKKDDKNYLLDGDESGMIVSGTRGNSADPNNWTGANPTDWEDEMNDELTESNISALTAFFSFINSEDFTKENVPQRMSVIDWIDYFIGLQVFLMRDNTCRNMILYAGKDKKKFYPFFYDLDLSWNFYASQPDIDIMTDSYAADMSLWENFKALYGDEIANRYAYLRGTVLNSDYFSALYKDIASNIPQEDVSLEYKKWGRGDITYMNDLFEAMDKRLEWLDKEYFKV